MLAPTAMDFSSGKVGTNGTDKSVPYKGAEEDNGVRCKIQQRTTELRSSHGFLRCSEPSYQRYMYP